jgi:hypothetical protein
MPAFSSVRNSASARHSFSGSRQGALAKTGQPVVSTEWHTLCSGCGVAFPSLTMAGKAARRVQTAGVICHKATANLDDMAATGAESSLRVTASNTRRDNGLTRRLRNRGEDEGTQKSVNTEAQAAREAMGFPSATVSRWLEDSDEDK